MIILSVLVPSIPERRDRALKLYDKLEKQSKGLRVEILLFIDNRQRSIGLKRDALMQVSKGKYVSFVDDDDDISDDYIETILELSKQNPDVITFKSKATINGTPYIINMSEEHTENEQLSGNLHIKRRPFTMCAFRGSLARRQRFKDISYSEDWDWCKRVLKGVQSEGHAKKILHFYNYTENGTAASRVANEVNKDGSKKKGKIQVIT